MVFGISVEPLKKIKIKKTKWKNIVKIQNIFSRIQSLIVWGVSDIYFILAVTVTIVFGVLSSDLQSQLNLSSAQLGFLEFGFFLSFGMTQLLAGCLVDSWGPKIALSLSACVAAIGLFLLSIAEGFYSAFIAQTIAGAGLSTSYVGAIYLATMWFSQKYFSLIAGVTLMSANIISASLISIMALTDTVMINFRVIMIALAIASLLLSILLFLIVRKSPFLDQNIPSKSQNSHFREDLFKLFHIPQFWLGTLYFSSTIGVYLAYSSLWNVPASLAFGHNLKTATLMSATLRYGTALGSLLSGFIAGYINNCSIIAKFYSSGALLLALILIYGSIFSVSVVFLVFFLLGFFFGGAALGFPLVGQYIPSTLKGTGFGLMAAMGYLLCAFLQYITGLLLGYEAATTSLSAIDAFKIALTPLVITLAIGWFCTLRLRDAKKQA